MVLEVGSVVGGVDDRLDGRLQRRGVRNELLPRRRVRSIEPLVLLNVFRAALPEGWRGDAERLCSRVRPSGDHTTRHTTTATGSSWPRPTGYMADERRAALLAQNSESCTMTSTAESMKDVRMAGDEDIAHATALPSKSTAFILTDAAMTIPLCR